MATTISLLIHSCGLSLREAADFLGVGHDALRSIASGRVKTQPEHTAKLKALSRDIAALAEKTEAEIEETYPEHDPTLVLTFQELTTVEQANEFGLPYVGAYNAALGMVISRSDRRFYIVRAPRGTDQAGSEAGMTQKATNIAS